MENNKKHEIQAKLEQASQDNIDLALAQRGCCKIQYAGATYKHSGITRVDCSSIANDYPGATYDFSPGIDCDDLVQ